MSWKGSIVRKGDVGTAKNYLIFEEIDELNRIVTMCSYGLRRRSGETPRTRHNGGMSCSNSNSVLSFNERDVLTHAGKLQMKVAQKLAAKRYDNFDLKRKERVAIAADNEDIKALENLAKDLQRPRRWRMIEEFSQRAVDMTEYRQMIGILPMGDACSKVTDGTHDTPKNPCLIGDFHI